jgi:hypothetical protein
MLQAARPSFAIDVEIRRLINILLPLSLATVAANLSDQTSEESVWTANGAMVVALAEANFPGVHIDGYHGAALLNVRRTKCEATFSISGRTPDSPGVVSSETANLECRIVNTDMTEGSAFLSLADWPIDTLALDGSLVVENTQKADQLFVAIKAAANTMARAYVERHAYLTAPDSLFEMYSLTVASNVYSHKYLVCQRESTRENEDNPWRAETTRCVFLFPSFR